MIGKPSGGVEAVKWLAFALMLLDHVTIFLTVERPAWAYLLGRLVFPLFVMALARGLASAGELAFDAAARRLLMFGFLAQLPFAYLVPLAVLNVLFTFAAGLLLYRAFAWPRWSVARVVLTLLALLAAGFVEFGPVGVMCVIAALGYERVRAWPHENGLLDSVSPRTVTVIKRGWLVAFWASLTLLHAVNGVPVAMVAPLVFWAVVKWCEVPRFKHAFYWLYPAQFAVIAVLVGLWGAR